MYHQKWLEVVQTALGEIESDYPVCNDQDRPKMRQRLQTIKESCDQLLESWAEVEERIALLLSQFPELANIGDDKEEIQEEVWLHESSVRSFRQGQGYYGLSMFQEAKEVFHQVVEQEPDFVLGRLYLALSQFQEGNWEESLSHFRMVIATAPHEAFTSFAQHMIGCIHVRQGNDQAALKEFAIVVSHTPDCGDAWFNLGACHYRLGSYHEAIPYFYHAINIEEDDWEAMYYLAQCYAKYQEWESVQFWRLACLEKTQHPQIIQALAHDYEEINNSTQAIFWYRRLLLFPTHELDAIHGISWNLWRQGEMSEAIAWLKKGLTLQSTHPELLFLYGWFLWTDGELDRLENLIQNLPGDLSEKAVWRVLSARLHFSRGNFENAIQVLDTVIEQETGNIEALGHFQKGRLLLELGRVEEAVTEFREAQKRSKRWEEPTIYLGICQLVEGRKV